MLGRKKADRKKKIRAQIDTGNVLTGTGDTLTDAADVQLGELCRQDGEQCIQSDERYAQSRKMNGVQADGRRNRFSGTLHVQPDENYAQQFSESEIRTQELTDTKVVTKQLKKPTSAAGTVKDRPCMVEIGTASVIGSRKSQQDSVFGYESDGYAIGIVCDGMGGLSGGEVASRVALQSLADAWFAQRDVLDIPNFFRREAVRADEKVYVQEAADGQRLQAGTTIVAAIVRRNELYWLSVGDSKLYFIRGEEMISLNVEHNYRLELNAMLREGRMTAEEYAAEEYRAEALTSYLGIGNLSLMDISPKAYPLKDGDIILLASDGLYRSLHEEDILTIVRKNRQDMQKAAEALTAAVKGRKKQDNTSVVILRYGRSR